MTIGLTTIPTETDGSLGRDKADQQAVPDLDHYVPAAEWNTVKSTVKDLADTVGTLVDPEEGTIEARLVSGASSRILCRPTAATATTGNLVSTTPVKDTYAAATIAYSSTIAGYKPGFVFTAGGAGSTNQYSAWKLNFALPQRYAIEFEYGNRTANIQPLLYFVFGDITHILAPYRKSTGGTDIDITGRNNSTSSVNYTPASGSPVIGLASEYGGKMRITVEMSSMAAGPLGTYTVEGFGTSTTGLNTMRNTIVGHFTSVDASWASLTNYIAVGCSEITTTPGDTTTISNIVVYKHPMDE